MNHTANRKLLKNLRLNGRYSYRQMILVHQLSKMVHRSLKRITTVIAWDSVFLLPIRALSMTTNLFLFDHRWDHEYVGNEIRVQDLRRRNRNRSLSLSVNYTPMTILTN